MLFFRKNRVALPNVRKLNRRIKKINKIRTNYLDYCNIIIDDANNFTDVMMKTHDEMIDAIKSSIKVEKDFDQVYTKYADLDKEDSDEDQDDDDDDDMEDFDISQFINNDIDDDDCDCDDCDCDEDCSCEAEDDSDDEEPIEDEVDSAEEVSNETTEDNSNEANDAETDEDSEEDSDDEDEEEVVINADNVNMRNFKGDAAKALFYTVNVMFNDEDMSVYDRVYTGMGLKGVEIDESQMTYYNDNKTIISNICHVHPETPEDSDSAKLIELVIPMPVIPHSNPCRKVMNDIINNSYITIIPGSKFKSMSTDSNMSTWYSCDGGEGTDYDNGDRILFVNVDISKTKKTATIRMISSTGFTDDEIRDIIK